MKIILFITIILTSILITFFGEKILGLEGHNLWIFCFFLGLINGGLIGGFFGKK